MINILNRSSVLLYILLSLTLLIGLVFGEDSSGGGSIGDFHKTLPLIENPFDENYTAYDFKFPLHYIIGYLIYNLFDNILLFKLFYIGIALILPLLFYKCLEIKFPFVNKNNLFIFSHSKIYYFFIRIIFFD